MDKTRKIVLTGLISLMGLIGNVQAQTRLTSDTIVMGDTTVMTVKGVESGMWAMDSNEFIEVLKEEPGRESGEWQVFLTSYDPGIHYVKLSDNDSLQLVVLGVDIDPSSDAPKEVADSTIEDIMDIEPDGKSSDSKCIPWLLIVAGIVAAALLTWWLLRRRKTKVEETPLVADTRTPEQRAFERLEELRQRQLWQSGRVKEYYTELTDTLRMFIEEATGIHATEKTSEETLTDVESGKWKVEKELLRNIFTTADLVKFAKSEPQPHEHQRVFDQSVAFVKETWASLNPKPTLTDGGVAETEKEVENG